MMESGTASIPKTQERLLFKTIHLDLVAVYPLLLQEAQEIGIVGVLCSPSTEPQNFGFFLKTRGCVWKNRWTGGEACVRKKEMKALLSRS
jgi:hypothetical protein